MTRALRAKAQRGRKRNEEGGADIRAGIVLMKETAMSGHMALRAYRAAGKNAVAACGELAQISHAPLDGAKQTEGTLRPTPIGKRLSWKIDCSLIWWLEFG